MMTNDQPVATTTDLIDSNISQVSWSSSDQRKLAKIKMETDECGDVDKAETFAGALWRRENFLESNSGLVASSNECLFAYKKGDKSSCARHPTGPDCKCPRKVFQSKRNSKRNLHVYRFLRGMFGDDFPIPDAMLCAMKPFLECSCDNGLM